MTLEALLTFFGIFVAVLAIARPVQRRSLWLFAPAWRVGAALLVSFALIICRDAPYAVSPPFGWSLSKVACGLTVGAFVIPVLAALWGWVSWDRAKLAGKKIGRVENIFKAAEPSEILFGPSGNNVQGLDAWRDLFLKEVRDRFTSANSAEKTALKRG